ncbi:MAG: ATP-dependent DNA helicase RecG [Oscillospiraceae bacterium]|jgi:ATP-dependent DNA helicase RecG|nr:ATP-dependent DNA helicase RecG [Oscillospiraceae bacterium]
MDIQYLKGIGEKRARLFQKLGLFSVEDVLAFVPRAYEDRTKIVPIRELRPGEAACFRATVASNVTGAHIRKGLDLYKTKVFDETGELFLTFFNAPYVKNALVWGETYVFFGKIGENRGMINPVFEREMGGTTGRILPVYRATAGLTQGTLRNAAKQALEKLEPPETLPDETRQTYSLCTARFAAENIHFPQTEELLSVARKRLVFEELLLLQLGLSVRRGRIDKTPGPPFKEANMEPFYKALPFEPTEAQRSAIGDIQKDCLSGMNRLIQGDVGCGKTAVAAAAAYMAFQNGYQTALMVPTEILAEQHARSLGKLFEPLGLRAGLLTGRDKKALSGIASGDIHLAVGTHALLSETVSFAKLGLVVTDEQHRFGVEQRARLFTKGEEPHRLVMSATPIPRTLARILYGDLDVTVMRGLPPGRMPVKTYVVDEEVRHRIEAFVRKTVQEGGQVYIVCPVIEENEELGLRSADAYAEEIRAEVYPDLRVGLLHGKIKAKDRESVMRGFADGEIDILVATTVIEVGVDVPNAALMVVENAERFGLSQLHQLRGRVGRGKRESHCVLFMQNNSARERLEVLRREHDGYAVAEADLRLRGPGDFFGNRQHGLPEFKIADLSNDMDVLQASREAAEALQGSWRQHAALKAAVEALLNRIEGGD